MADKNLKELFQEELGKDWKKELTEIIQAVVKKELQEHESHECRLAITDKEAKELAYFFRMIRGFGNGHIADGMKMMQDNHEWMATQRKLGSKISTLIISTVIFSLIGGVCYYLWAGIKSAIGR